MAVSRFCPQCGAAHVPSAAICLECGTDLRTGQRAAEFSGSDTDEERESLFFQVVQPVAEYLPGLFRLKAFLLSIMLCFFALVVAALCLVFLRMGLILVALPTGGFALIIYGTAVAWILTGEVAFLSTCMADFRGTQWLLFLVLLAAPFVIGAVGVKIFAALMA